MFCAEFADDGNAPLRSGYVWVPTVRSIALTLIVE